MLKKVIKKLIELIFLEKHSSLMNETNKWEKAWDAPYIEKYHELLWFLEKIATIRETYESSGNTACGEILLGKLQIVHSYNNIV